MITETLIVGDREFFHYIPENGGKIKCVETEELFDSVYIPSDTVYTFEEVIDDSEISDTEALNIITGRV